MRSARLSWVQSSTGIGGYTTTSTVPGLNVLESRAAMTSALRITIGTIGIPADIAMRNGPFLNEPTSVVSSRVPSGAIRMDRPLRASSSTFFSPSTAFLGSSRSMNAASITLPIVPTMGSFSSSFLPTDVKLSLTNRPAIIGSTWLRWLKTNTAGRLAVRFSSPSTLRLTPVAISSARPKLDVKKLTPLRLLRFSRPQPMAPAAIGTMDATPATVRSCEIGLLPLRLLNLNTGHPRLAATAASLPAGLVGRGLPTRYISATSSSPSA